MYVTGVGMSQAKKIENQTYDLRNQYKLIFLLRILDFALFVLKRIASFKIVSF